MRRSWVRFPQAAPPSGRIPPRFRAPLAPSAPGDDHVPPRTTGGRLDMSKRSAVLMITAILFGTGLVAAPAASAATPTDRVVLRPVTSSGHAAAGYKVVKEPDHPVDCSIPDPSVAGVNKNILFCSPSAAYAVACWRSATPHHVL